MSERRWQPGEQITLRYTGHSHGEVQGRPGLLMAWGFTVVEDSEDLLALWLAPGSLLKYGDMADRTNFVKDELWSLGTLRLMFPGKSYSIWLFYGSARALGDPVAHFHAWEALREQRARTEARTELHAGEFLGYYVNLEAPFVRTPIGVDTTDNVLDVVVAPDLTWQWKDEHQVQRWIDLGVYTREEFAGIRQDGLDAIAAVEARAFPFNGAYLDWQPPAEWTLPAVHPEWDRIPDYDLPRTTGRRLTGVESFAMTSVHLEPVERWQPGEHVTLRYTGHYEAFTPADRRPGVLQAWPHTVVADSEDVLVLWMPGGTRTYHAHLADRTIEIEDGVWRFDTLRVFLPGKPYSVWLSWATARDPAWPVGPNPVQRYYDRIEADRIPRAEPTPRDNLERETRLRERAIEDARVLGAPGEFRGYYVNLEAPYLRTPIGIDTSDNSLDVVVAPDLTWRWKDEDTMPFWVEMGVFTPEHVEQFYRDGRAAIALVEARAFPFDGSYIDWRPDPAWTLPEVHPEWRTLEGYDWSHAIKQRLENVDHPR